MNNQLLGPIECTGLIILSDNDQHWLLMQGIVLIIKVTKISIESSWIHLAYN